MIIARSAIGNAFGEGCRATTATMRIMAFSGEAACVIVRPAFRSLKEEHDCGKALARSAVAKDDSVAILAITAIRRHYCVKKITVEGLLISERQEVNLL